MHPRRSTLQGAGDVIEVQYVLGRYDAAQPDADTVQARRAGRPRRGLAACMPMPARQTAFEPATRRSSCG